MRVATGKSLAEMTTDIFRVNQAKGWRPNGNSFGDYIALLHSEVSEAFEAFREHGLRDRTEPASGDRILKPEGVGSELADVLIRLLDMADVYGIDLEFEYERKIAYNQTRSRRHGGKAL